MGAGLPGVKKGAQQTQSTIANKVFRAQQMTQLRHGKSKSIGQAAA
jgi:hypothetical protein